MKMTPIDRGTVDGVNKYGKNKVWDDEGKTGQAFVSADDSMAYVSKPKVAVINNGAPVEQEPTTEQPATQEQAQDKYSKVDYKKRYDDLKRHYDAKLAEFKEKEQKLLSKVNETVPSYKPPSTLEELEEFKRENPKLYAVVESVAHLRATNETKELASELQVLREKLARADAEKAYALLKAQVPDYEEIRQSDDFHDWAEAQPQEIQDWIYRNSTNVDLAVKAIRLYKADRGNAAAQPQQPPVTVDQPGADAYIPTRGSVEEPGGKEKVWRTSEIARLSSSQYERLRDEIDRAFFEGRVIRDTK